MQPIQFARIRKILPPAIAVLTILLCALSTAYSLRLILRAYHGAILLDEWDSIDFFDRLRQGTVTFHDFIRQHNEHRILFPRLVFALDLALSEARNTINLASILVCQALHVLLFHRLISIGAQDRLLKWTLTAFVTLMLFSIVQKENFVWAFQIQFVGVFLFFTLAASTLSAAQASAGGTRWPSIAAGFFFGAVAALVMSNGVAALLCIAFVFAAARLFNRLTAAIALCGLVLLVCYAATFTPNPGHTPLGFAAQHPLIFIQYLSTYLGCVFAPLGLKVAFGAGLLGVTGTAVALLALFTGRLERNRTNLTLVAILVFVGLTAALTAIGRSSFGLEQAASSRYATPSAIFWTAAVTLTALWLSDRGAQRARALPALALVCGMTLISVAAAALVQYEFRYQGRIRAADMARASDAILSAVPDELAWKVLFPDIALMKQRIPILQAHRLNIFSQPPPGRSAARSPRPASRRRPVAPAMSTRSNRSRVRRTRSSSRAGPGIAPRTSRSNGWSWFRARDAWSATALPAGRGRTPRGPLARTTSGSDGRPSDARPPGGSPSMDCCATARFARSARRRSPEGGARSGIGGPWRRRSWRACVADLPSRTAGYNAARPPVPSARSRDASRVAGATVRTDPAVVIAGERARPCDRSRPRPPGRSPPACSLRSSSCSARSRPPIRCA